MTKGGLDTTYGAISSAILAMVLNPLVQQKAQAEIDSVVGRERLPDWNDRSSLPYIGALCREVLRWAPVIPLSGFIEYVVRSDADQSDLAGVMRETTEDDVYEGMFIPKGA